MKIILEVHRYAPELNKAYIGPKATMVPAPGCTSIRAVRKSLFPPLAHRGRYVTLRSTYPEPNATYGRTRHGFCNTTESLRGALKIFRDYHNLPDCKITVKTRLIG